MPSTDQEVAWLRLIQWVCCDLQVVVAYLMKQEGLSRDEALASVKKARDCAEPNSGFMTQLEHWGDMGCQVKVCLGLA